MKAWADRDELARLHRNAEAASRRIRLPLRNQVWRGDAGNWSGAGVGSSIDFQDHRPYLPGDDPRHIDWQVFARSGHYSMKLYREEVSPLVDIAWDVSASMALGKADRSVELLYFAVECAARAGASVAAWSVGAGEAHPLPRERLLAYDLPAPRAEDREPAMERIAWRRGSLRVVISDLLFPAPPEPLLAPVCAGRGRPLLLVPQGADEARPDWSGNVEFRDCESGARRLQRFDDGLRRRYEQAYARHFDRWREAARRHAAALVTVPAEGELAAALLMDGVPRGALELAG